MSEKKSYLVKEPVRFGGQRRNVGDSLDLTAAEAAELAAFLEGETPARVKVLVVDDGTSGPSIAGLLAALGLKEQAIEVLSGQLAEKENHLIELDDLAARLLTSMEERDKEIETLKRDLAAVSNANTLNAADLKTARERIASLEAELDTTSDELATARAQIAGLEQQLAALKTPPAPKKGGKS